MARQRRSNLLIAGLWIGIWAVCWPVGRVLLVSTLPPQVKQTLFLLIWFLAIVSLFAAGGALFGRTGMGTSIGIAIAFMLLMLPLLSFSP